MEVLRHYDYDVPVHAINVLADLKLHRPVDVKAGIDENQVRAICAWRRHGHKVLALQIGKHTPPHCYC